jgi:hypothetical protein
VLTSQTTNSGGGWGINPNRKTRDKGNAGSELLITREKSKMTKNGAGRKLLQL